MTGFGRRARRGYAWPRVIITATGDGGGRGGCDHGRGREGGFFGTDGIFGPRGVFGPDGPFGPRGPFGPDGPFGPGGSGASGPGWDRGRNRGWDRGSRSRRRGRMFGQGELRLVLLRLIADAPRHGYELIKAVEEMTAGSYAPSPGTVYPTLSLLEDEGAIREIAGSDEPRKAFEATDQGRAELDERKEEADALLDRLSGQGERHAERSRAFATPEMFRALGNLAQVVKIKARRGTLDEAAMAQIVDLIDEMARKIERL